jgi:hypothetical protein
MGLGVTGLLGNNRALGAATTVTIISGDIQIRHSSAGAFVPATDGEVITAGDTIRTGANSRAVLTYFEGSTVTVEPDSELVVEAVGAQTDGSTVVVMQQNAGRTWHVVTRLISGNSKYEVKTPASTASVRGTAFDVTIKFDSNNEPTAQITTTEGTVVHSAPDPVNPTQTIEVPVTAGKTESVKKGEAPAPVKDAPAPERKVTVNVESPNSLVVDPLGRANGVKDGKVIIQTPGAQVVRDGENVRVIMPDVPDGKFATRVEKKTEGGDKSGANSAPSTDAPVLVRMTLEQIGQAPVVVTDHATVIATNTKNMEIKAKTTNATVDITPVTTTTSVVGLEIAKKTDGTVGAGHRERG